MNAPRPALLWCSGWLVALLATAAERSPIPAGAGSIKGFTVPAKEFLLKGASATPLGEGRVRVEGITVETRRGTRELDFRLETPSGVFDQANDRIDSTNLLAIRSLDGRFEMRGLGYQFRPRTNFLALHSNVFTRFDRSFFGTNLAKPRESAAATNGALEVTSTTFEYLGTTGDATYRDRVHLTDGTTLTLDAGEFQFNVASLTNEVRQARARDNVRLALQLELESARARADEAVFSTAPGIDARLDLAGDAQWNYGRISGSAGRLHWQTASNQYEFVGEGGARLRFPDSALGTNGLAVDRAATNASWVDIASTRHRFVPGRLLFDGGVRAWQDTNWSLAARSFDITLDATNHPRRLEAAGDFVLEVAATNLQGRATAGHALVENPAAGKPLVILTENPRWVSPAFTKSADRIQVADPLGDPVYIGDGRVRLELTGLELADFEWFGARTNTTTGTAAAITNTEPARSVPVVVAADHSEYHGGLATFTGNVAVTQGTNYLHAARLELRLSAERKLTNLVARGGVRVRQNQIVVTADQVVANFTGERGLPQVVASGNVRLCGTLEQGIGRGEGTTLRYDGVSGDAVLEGEPKLAFFNTAEPDPKKRLRPRRYLGPVLYWNLRDGKMGTQGKFSVMPLPADTAIPQDCD